MSRNYPGCCATTQGHDCGLACTPGHVAAQHPSARMGTWALDAAVVIIGVALYDYPCFGFAAAPVAKDLSRGKVPSGSACRP